MADEFLIIQDRTCFCAYLAFCRRQRIGGGAFGQEFGNSSHRSSQTRLRSIKYSCIEPLNLKMTVVIISLLPMRATWLLAEIKSGPNYTDTTPVFQVV